MHSTCDGNWKLVRENNYVSGENNFLNDNLVREKFLIF